MTDKLISDLAGGIAAADTDVEILLNSATTSTKETIGDILDLINGDVNVAADLASTIADNAVTLAMMAGGTDGNLITYDTSGDPAFVATGDATQILTSNGVDTAPTFQAPASRGWTARIPMVMELPQVITAYPSVLAVATNEAFKITGFVFPDGAVASILNLKCDVPDNLHATPAAAIVFKFLTQSAETGANTRMLVATGQTADAESADVDFTDETEATVPMPAAIETFEYYTQDLTTDPTAGDQLWCKIQRDPVDAADTYAGDPILIGAWLQIEVLVD